MSDYPAAHSMDMFWFAVDKDGNVALFDTGEGGSKPKGIFPVFDEEEFLARVLLARAQSDSRLRALLPETLPQLERAIDSQDSYELVSQLLRTFGVWTYDCPEQWAMPYLRYGGEVPNPISVEELDEETRRSLMYARLPVRFREHVVLAPGEYLPVNAWGPVWFDSEGYPHATSGSEKEFKELADELTRIEPDWKLDYDGDPALGGESVYAAVEELLSEWDGR